MNRIVLAASAAVALAVASHPAAAAGGSMPAPIVFFDIAGPDLAKQAAFYKAVFDWQIGGDGRFSAPVAPRLDATLRQDPADKILYVGVDDVTATLAKVTANGGQVIQPRFEVKGVVVLGLFKDPAGNSMGLVELKDGKPKIP
jgi:predicted enzyme related to lactoylglutathione lyase